WEGGNPVLTGLLVLLGIIAFAIIVAIADSSSPTTQPLQASPTEAVEDGVTSTIVQASVKEVFGEGRDPAWLWNVQPELARTFTSNALSGVRAGTDHDALIDKAVAIVRMRGYLNGRKLSGDLFETT